MINFNDDQTNFKSPKPQSSEGDMFPGLQASESYKMLNNKRIEDVRVDPSPVRHPSLGRMQHTRNFPSSYAFADSIQNSEEARREGQFMGQRTSLIKNRMAND